jgi:leucyl aminopeptidase
VTIAFSVSDAVPEDVSVVGVPIFEGRTVPSGAGALVDVGQLGQRGFEGKLGETMVLPSGNGTTLIAVGLGPEDKVDSEVLRRAAAALVKEAWKDTNAATTVLAGAPGHLDRALAAQAVAEGAALASYRFTKYKADAEAKVCRLQSLVVVGNDDGIEAGLERGARLAGAVNLARDLVNEPAGSLTPQRLAEVAAEVAAAPPANPRPVEEAALRSVLRAAWAGDPPGMAG